ncbi:hypothetical protein AVEN_215526-1 [Araneus ventricosus]|uniref:Uncharacterized protein n=1 Tax=Araneus ventricosus TaxID=182803 RepID=A0A4Y2BHA8_ARAVE|nr:hypothetical protein AVEN_215526-1 [Araneus ventricosus]
MCPKKCVTPHSGSVADRTNLSRSQQATDLQEKNADDLRLPALCESLIWLECESSFGWALELSEVTHNEDRDSLEELVEDQ